MILAQHYDLALAYAQKQLEARGVSDRGGMRARQMAGAVMEACADKELLHVTHSLGHFWQRSLQCCSPNTTSAEIAARDFERYAKSQAFMGAGPYAPSIADHLGVPSAERSSAWEAAMDMAQHIPQPAALNRAHPLRHHSHAPPLFQR